MLTLPAALVVVTLAAAQRAPSPEEQKAFTEGLRLYEAGDARGAERAWKAGYAAGHDPAFLVRIGEAQEKAGAPKQAAGSYEQYLRESPDAADRPEIEARIRRLAPPSSARPPTPVERDNDIPGEMRAAPGTSPGSAEGPAPGSSSASPPAAPAQSAPAQSARAQQVPDDQNDDLAPIADDAPRSRLNGVAWIATGVTALLLGVAAFYGASAAEKSGDANSLLTYADQLTFVPREYSLVAAQYEEDLRVGRRDDRIARGFVIAAGATAVAATVLFILDARSEKPAMSTASTRGLDLRPRAAGADRGLDLSFSWGF